MREERKKLAFYNIFNGLHEMTLVSCTVIVYLDLYLRCYYRTFDLFTFNQKNTVTSMFLYINSISA